MRIARALPVLLTAVALFLSGCADEKDADAAQTPPFNSADVTFVQGMVPHHRQAIQMAKLAAQRAAHPEVEELATRIEDAQAPEIRMMQGWLRAWNKPLESDKRATGSMGHGGSMTGMSGMMPMNDMQHLRSVKGSAFDEAFLSMMIEHHKGAIHMAHAEEQHGVSPHALALAKKIQHAQSAEIQKMTAMLPG